LERGQIGVNIGEDCDPHAAVRVEAVAVVRRVGGGSRPESVGPCR
jgi:hypothetical protein